MRWRNEESPQNHYDINMNTCISRDWTVHDTLQVHPDTMHVFVGLKTNCIGCRLERLCTLEEVSRAYNIPIEILLKDLVDVDPIYHSEESLR